MVSSLSLKLEKGKKASKRVLSAIIAGRQESSEV
jgi:hypothetical protein